MLETNSDSLTTIHCARPPLLFRLEGTRIYYLQEPMKNLIIMNGDARFCTIARYWLEEGFRHEIPSELACVKSACAAWAREINTSSASSHPHTGLSPSNNAMLWANGYNASLWQWQSSKSSDDRQRCGFKHINRSQETSIYFKLVESHQLKNI